MRGVGYIEEEGIASGACHTNDWKCNVWGCLREWKDYDPG